MAGTAGTGIVSWSVNLAEARIVAVLRVGAGAAGLRLGAVDRAVDRAGARLG